MQIKKQIVTLEDIKNEILDISLIASSAIGFVVYLISLYKWIAYGFQITFIINFFIIATLAVVMFMRKKVGIKTKTYTLIFLILALTISDVVAFGLLSAARVYVVLIPFFCVLFLSTRSSFIIYSITMIAWLGVGFLHHKGILRIPDKYIPNLYILELYPWIINFLHLFLVGIIILLVTRRFILAQRNIINNQDHLIRERTDSLLSANEELRATTEELFKRKEQLESTLVMLQKTQNQLIDSEKMASLGILASGVAHEINNPLNFINGGVNAIENYIRDHLRDHAQNLVPVIKDMQTGISRATEIVNSLNYYSMQDREPVTVVDPHSIIDSCLVMLNHRLKFKVKVIRKYTKEPVSFIAHEDRLHQVFMNILSNAEQSIEKDGIIEIETEVSDKNLLVKISDNGHGIKKEDMLRITDPFFTTKEPGKGTGLGLSVTRAILQNYNAVIHFSSKPGQGTSVTIEFPLNQKIK